jgi:hypothetical protein
MIKNGRLLFCAVGVLLSGMGTRAFATLTSAEHPYQAIKARNAFGLIPPAPAPPPVDETPTPPKIFLQGFTTVLDVKQALFKVQMPARPGEPNRGERSFVLGEGRRDGELEVIQIDEKAGRVKVRNFGTIMVIDFENNGIKIAAAPVPGPFDASPASPRVAGFAPTARPNPFTSGAGGLARQLPPLPRSGASPPPALQGLPR